MLVSLLTAHDAHKIRVASKILHGLAHDVVEHLNHLEARRRRILPAKFLLISLRIYLAPDVSKQLLVLQKHVHGNALDDVLLFLHVLLNEHGLVDEIEEGAQYLGEVGNHRAVQSDLLRCVRALVIKTRVGYLTGNDEQWRLSNDQVNLLDEWLVLQICDDRLVQVEQFMRTGFENLAKIVKDVHKS